MKKIVIYTLITFIFSVFASSCEDNKDNSLYYPDSRGIQEMERKTKTP